MAGSDKRVVTFTMPAEELRSLVRHLEVELPAMGYSSVLETLMTAKERLAGDRIDIQMSVDEATVLHDWVRKVRVCYGCKRAGEMTEVRR